MKLDDFLKPKKVRCVNNENRRDLTKGKLYDVAGATYGRLKIRDDNGGISWHDMDFFELVIESAENPLQGVQLTPEFESLPDGLKSSQTPITSFSFIDVLKKSAQSILTQDNAATANPAYCVKERKKVFGVDKDYENDGYDWACLADQESWSDGDAFHDALDTFANDLGEDEITINGSEYEKVYYRFQERTVTTCFTREQAQRYIDENRHNLKNPSIYVESFNRNPEMLAVRELLICLAENPTMFDAVMVTEGSIDE